MRLTCPNCAAQYEVPEDVIPDEGRDVQCSNCGETWFQASAKSLAAEATVKSAPASEDDEAAAAEPTRDMSPDAPAADTSEEGERLPDAAEGDESVAHGDEEAEEHSPQAAPSADEGATVADEDAEPNSQPATPKRKIDPEISKILREEAEREAALRSARRAPIETQAELGLDSGNGAEHPSSSARQTEEEPTPDPRDDIAEDTEEALRDRQFRDRMARLRGEPQPSQFSTSGVGNVGGTTASPPGDTGSRANLLPEIDDVSPALSQNETDQTPLDDMGEPEAIAAKPSGFGRGFLLAVCLFVIAGLVYANAPAIAARLPQADPVLNAYVAWVDSLRLWLDDQVRALISS